MSGSQSLPIEFACGNCGEALATPTSSIGAQVKCPGCQTVQTVPSPTREQSPPAGPMAPVTPPPPIGGGNNREQLPGSVAGGTASESYAGKETPTKKLFDRITGEISKIYVGQDELVLGALVALFSNGHVLIESVPGLGKTLLVRTLGQVLGCHFGRIQFTADLMPSDITGAPIFDMKIQEFRFRPGPVFTQLLLADEINRSPAKTHAALLEIMQEYRVTIDGKSHEIDRPFLVLATQNPIESEGTYNLPEAQLDRFMFKLIADYPTTEDEARILDLHSRQMDINDRLTQELETVTSPEEILAITRENADVRMDTRLIDYINRIVRLTREWPNLHMGASPRAGLALVQGARTLAALRGRDYAVPDDVVEIALPVLRHRVILSAEAEVEGHEVDELLRGLVRSVEVPRL
jgi:MoxR-like ATPase